MRKKIEDIRNLPNPIKRLASARFSISDDGFSLLQSWGYDPIKIFEFDDLDELMTYAIEQDLTTYLLKHKTSTGYRFFEVAIGYSDRSPYVMQQDYPDVLCFKEMNDSDIARLKRLTPEEMFDQTRQKTAEAMAKGVQRYIENADNPNSPD